MMVCLDRRVKYFRSITEATGRKTKAGTLQALLLLLLLLTRLVILIFILIRMMRIQILPLIVLLKLPTIITSLAQVGTYREFIFFDERQASSFKHCLGFRGPGFGV